MTNSIPPTIFFAVLFINVAAGTFGEESLAQISKPLIIVSLLWYFHRQLPYSTRPGKALVWLALMFSWVGDVLLMFQPKNENFFLAGLVSFLVAHVFYISFFHRIRVGEKVTPKLGLVLAAGVYYVGLIAFLSPGLAGFAWPVRIYGLVICFMLVLALHLLFIRNKTAGRFFAFGALLFVISDSALAINKFCQPFPMAHAAIMITYGLAQFFITEGAIKYLREKPRDQPVIKTT